jgi:4-amino-4-deoxy-L-arabinose transferase-like glycosyltransferase
MLPALLVGGLIWLARSIFLTRSYDVFIDEITYARLSEQVADAGRVWLYGEPFYLHPPAFFVLAGAFLALFGLDASLLETIFALRHFNIVVAALTGVGIWSISRGLAGRRAGMLAVLLFGLEPFIIRMNSRVLLETMALWWVVAGYWALVAGLSTQSYLDPIPPPDRKARFRWIWRAEAAPAQTVPRSTATLAGLCFGVALLTKDMTAFLTILPLAICWVFKWSLPRRTIAYLLALIVASYTLYLAAIVASGQGMAFMTHKGRGIARLLGLIQETGLNRDVGPSLAATLMARLSLFITTYSMIALGGVALLALFWRGGSGHRLIAVWTASAYALLIYCIGLGTLEEQFFYLLVIPVLVTLSIVGGPLLPMVSLRRDQRHPLRCATPWIYLGIALFGIWSSYQWITIHLSPHNTYQQLLVYVDQNLQPGESIAATSETAQFLLAERTSPPWGDWSEPSELDGHQPDYLLLSVGQLEWDHGPGGLTLRDWVEANGTHVFTFGGEGDGPLVLYRLRWLEKE